MKKVLIVLLALSAFLVLPGCGDDKPDVDKAKEAAEDVKEEMGG